MNRILFESREPAYTLDPRDPRFEHVRRVLRMRVGDSFDVGLVNGPVGKATITALQEASMGIAVEWGTRPPLPPPVRLMVGMCRPATARKILTIVPTLGVRELVFTGTARSDPAYARSGLWREGGWRRHLIEGVEQAFDTFVPRVEVFPELGTAAGRVPDDCRRLALDVYEGTRPLSAVSVGMDEPACLAVGPERGWAKSDRDALRSAGFNLVSLGERVMRVETAVVSGLTLLLARMGRL